MTLIYHAQLPAEQPQTHVLLIGVNSYPHLPGGELRESEPAPRDFSLRQLTSPVISATSLADWFLGSHHNDAAPLGSVELLLSPAEYKPSPAAAAKLGLAPGATLTVDEAKFSPIKAAAGRWFLAANRHRDNVALFYYCGHGLEASDRYLLPADFGANPLDWTDNIINFSATHKNMERCQAKTQCFFLDACRDRPQELQSVAAQRTVGQALIGPQAGLFQERDAPIFHAATPGRSAAGPSGDKSYFMSALLHCLNGIGARQILEDSAPVDSASLSSALREYVDRIAEENGLLLKCAVTAEWQLPQPADLHHAPLPIQVLATIACEPEQAQQVATLSLKDSAGVESVRTSANEKPWRLSVTAGKCVVAAKFNPADPFKDLTREEILFPPVFRLPLAIQTR